MARHLLEGQEEEGRVDRQVREAMVSGMVWRMPHLERLLLEAVFRRLHGATAVPPL